MERYRRRSKIDEATSNDEKTPPVWILDDILAILNEGDFDAVSIAVPLVCSGPRRATLGKQRLS